MTTHDSSADPSTKRLRRNTRRRLLDAAYEVYADIGFGHTTVEKVAEHAGFTRGAFYSNFSSLEELFLEMWAERQSAMVAEIETTFSTLADLTSDDDVGISDIVTAVTQALPVDEHWLKISSEVTAHALRNPELRANFGVREAAISEAMLPVAVELLGHIGRTVPNPKAFVDALIAVYDGTNLQVVMRADDPTIVEHRRQLFEHVFNAYTVVDGEDRGSHA